MTRTFWILFAIAAASAAGGAIFYFFNQISAEDRAPLTPAAAALPPTPAPPARDTLAEKLRGIGSMRDLKPVEIPN